MSSFPWMIIFRRFLRFLFWTLSFLLILAISLAIVRWHRSSTPLVFQSPEVRPPSPEASGNLHFPGPTWELVDPALLGWDKDALQRTHALAQGFDTSSLIVLHRGLPIALWGEVTKRENSQSIRKSLLSSLFGELFAEGRLNPDTTLAELDIDDDPPLMEKEKTASIRDLMLSRSGVYHSALYEASSWKRHKPERGSVSPGEEWYYNNWGFNALATIFDKVSEQPIGEAFAELIATPIGMEDFRPQDVIYIHRNHPVERMRGNQSDHPAYVFMISARDLARFGHLYLTEGRWRDRQILPAEWIHESTFGAAQETGMTDYRYGYLWWIRPPDSTLPYESLVASGGRGHELTVIPALDLVIVHRIPTGGTGLATQLFRRYIWHPSVDNQQHNAILAGVLEAYPDWPNPPAVEESVP